VEDSSGISLGIVIAFVFLMVMISLATINFRLASQRREAKELRESTERAQREGDEVRRRAVAEAVRRDPSLAQATSAADLNRLNESALSIAREWQTREELTAVHAAKAREKEAEEAKYAAARRKISFAISSRRFSRRNRTSSDCSALVIPSLMPSSMSSWRIHRRTPSSATPKPVATSGIVKSPRRATATTCLLNSSGYLFGITTSSPQAMKPAQRVSTQPTAIRWWGSSGQAEVPTASQVA